MNDFMQPIQGVLMSIEWKQGDTAYFNGHKGQVLAVYPSGLHEIFVFNQVVRCSAADLTTRPTPRTIRTEDIAAARDARMDSDHLPRTDVRTMQVKPALCLDLDGTVRYSKNGKFINKPEDIALFEGVETVLHDYRDRGFLIFGISNQGGVAYGLKTPAQEHAELDTMIALFQRNPFDLIKTCWHHPGGKAFPFNYRSLFRKPSIGMLAQCEYECFNAGLVVDWDKSLFVGDRPEDEQCAAAAQIPFHWAHEFFGREKIE
jgi:D-glycero-D-manno-heptose 1,7-bisphosphate phosphatase